MQFVFIGGPGRSGTSYVMRSLSHHPDICLFSDVELKIFSELDGLIDLYVSLVLHYSPQRSALAIKRFNNLVNSLIEYSASNQLPLWEYAPKEKWQAIFKDFIEQFMCNGQPHKQSAETFFACCNHLLNQVASIAKEYKADTGTTPSIFCEKTPHNLLQMKFIGQLAPNAKFLHIMRDPRSIAASLLKMPWGPKTIEASAEWVISYCEAWRNIKEGDNTDKLLLHEFFIEKIAADPKYYSTRITTLLGITANDNLFVRTGPSLEHLNRWSENFNSTDIDYLNSKLNDWINYFGYSIKKLGVID